MSMYDTLGEDPNQNFRLPDDGGTALWLHDGEFTPLVETCAQVDVALEHAKAHDERWCQFTLLADANDDHASERRPCFVRPAFVSGMTYMSPEMVQHIENEID